MTNAEYRAVDAISNSDLSYIETNPYLYALGFRPQKESKSLELGSLIHTLSLEPENFKKEYAIKPAELKGKRKGNEELESWLAKNQDKTIITESDYELALSLSERVRKILSNLTGKAEQSFFANWNELIKVKCRPDFLTDDGVLVDLKTTRKDITSDYYVSREIYDYKYHRQLAFYKMVLELCNIEVKECVIILADTSNKWVRGVKILPEDLQRGHNEAVQILDRYNTILRNGLTLDGLFKPIELPVY